ncbi:PACE efflux transporter [Shigella sp. FC1967]|uniref:PACE efflux transporter n=1 Tax=Shigella sp. FC1967 TaxID=1898041 RepID=UPI00256FF8FE|nr:PACE efflux transporter [Shigella sp. FC1967]
MGTVAIVLSTLAMLLNLFYNMIFDRYWPLIKGPRPTKVRIMHTIGFELSFVIIGLPILAFFIKYVTVECILIRSRLFLPFFLFYTYAFNLSYDKLRENWFNYKGKRVISR